ncbi:shikimate dehydrogenase [Thermithiobacillus plumbiphilus]|uniref:Shikimate dehydrogenase (NADP(+)) n=1 Tax=Thermithiobacillus plumbiphilus TaxID=1729899 RepID=A0ABU9D5Q2_9PROT
MQRRPITGRTAVYGILGHPVEHSLSPLMHASFAEQTGVDMAYVPFPVAGADFAAAFKGLRALGVRGANVTVPHKERAHEMADALSLEAREIGAVNTLQIRPEGVYGHNTDAAGFMAALDDTGLDWRGRRALVIGAGGAARAILWALGAGGAERIHLANRTLARAQELARHFAKLPIQPIALERASLDAILPGIGLVVNTSSRGLHGEDHPELDLDKVDSSGIICDIVYNPIDTPLLLAAQSKGLCTVDGLGMLLHQGAESFRLWTGQQPSVAGAREILRQWLASTRKHP